MFNGGHEGCPPRPRPAVRRDGDPRRRERAAGGRRGRPQPVRGRAVDGRVGRRAAARDRPAHSAGDLGYTEALGVPALRSAIAQHYRDRYDVALDPRRVAVTTGSSGGFVLAFLAAFDVGDRVALAVPGYPAYANILAALGCEVVIVPCGPETRYQPTVAQLEALDPPVDGLVVASPANPTGTMIDPDELAALAAWCGTHGVRLVSDEIYHGITYGSEATATAAQYLDSGAVVVNSFSKYWAMTGLAARLAGAPGRPGRRRRRARRQRGPVPARARPARRRRRVQPRRVRGRPAERRAVRRGARRTCSRGCPSSAGRGSPRPTARSTCTATSPRAAWTRSRGARGSSTRPASP